LRSCFLCQHRPQNGSTKFQLTSPTSIRHNWDRGRFHQQFTKSLYACSSPKRKNSVKLSVSFYAFGIYAHKSCTYPKTLMKLSSLKNSSKIQSTLGSHYWYSTNSETPLDDLLSVLNLSVHVLITKMLCY